MRAAPPRDRRGTAIAGSIAIAGPLVIAGLLAIAGCRGGEERRPDVVLISLDTVRRDAVGVFAGADAPSPTPALDALAADAVLFQRAYAPIPFTLSSHMSLFTGLDPDVHGVLERSQRLGEGIVTLPQTLKAAGYATYGLVTNNWMKGAFGFDRGFDRYERLPHDLTYAERLRAEVAAILDRAVGGGDGDGGERPPLFLFLHFLDAHSDFERPGHTLPYHAPAPYRADLGIGTDDPRFCDPEGRCATAFLIAADREGRAVEPATVATAHQLYRRGVRYLDAELGALFDDLRRRGLYDGTLIAVVSDHGEEFREHGRFIHAQPYEECVAVPMLLKLPGNAHRGITVDVAASLIDLAPTLLDYLGLPAPARQGTSLLPWLDSGESAAGAAREILVQDKRTRQRYGLRLGRHKLIHDYRDGRSELYDLEADPAERVDLAAREPALVADLRRRLDERLRRGRDLATHLATGPAADGQEVLTTEEREQLRAIGYVD